MGSECERYWSLLFLLTGHPRRIADPTAYEFLRTPGVARMNRVMTVGAIGLGLTQLRIAFDFAYGLVSGRKAADNPWRANTLKWSTSSPPPHYNFERPPTVYHPPYEYSVPGAEDGYLPQTRPRPAASGPMDPIMA